MKSRWFRQVPLAVTLVMALILAGGSLVALSQSKEAADAFRRVLPGFPPPIDGEPLAPEWTEPEADAQAEAARSVIGGTPDHPTVIPPQPLLPPMQSGGDPVQGKVEMNTTAEEAVPKPVEKPAATVQPAAKPAKPAQAKSTATTPSGRPKQKQVVQFPEGTQPRADETSRRRAAAARPDGLRPYYPKGYRPYIPPVNPEVQRVHQQAHMHYNRAGYYGTRNQLEQAIDEYHRAIVLEPGFSDAYIGLATARMRTSDWENVLNHTWKGLKLPTGFRDPANIVQAHYNLTVAYCAVDDYRRAKRYYEYVKRANHPATHQLWLLLERSCKP